MATQSAQTTQKLIDPGEKHIILTLGESVGSNPNYSLTGEIKNIDNLNEATRILLFHQLCSKLDKDWPYTLYAGSSGTIATKLDDVYIPPDICPKCGGLIYLNPSLTYNIIINIAKVVGLTVRVCMMLNADSCTEGAEYMKAFKASNGLSPADDPFLHTSPYTRFSTPERIQLSLQEATEQIYNKEQSIPFSPLEFYSPQHQKFQTLEQAIEHNKQLHKITGQ